MDEPGDGRDGSHGRGHPVLSSGGQRLLIPPSITNSLPTVNAPSSEARNTTACAISVGVPRRPSGIWPISPSSAAPVSPSLSCNGVATGPGLTALTRIPRPISSPDSVRASETSPALVRA
jgi:hypothetical protein